MQVLPGRRVLGTVVGGTADCGKRWLDGITDTGVSPAFSWCKYGGLAGGAPTNELDNAGTTGYEGLQDMASC
jgi:hypothetical protein